MGTSIKSSYTGARVSCTKSGLRKLIKQSNQQPLCVNSWSQESTFSTVQQDFSLVGTNCSTNSRDKLNNISRPLRSISWFNLIKIVLILFGFESHCHLWLAVSWELLGVFFNKFDTPDKFSLLFFLCITILLTNF